MQKSERVANLKALEDFISALQLDKADLSTLLIVVVGRMMSEGVPIKADRYQAIAALQNLLIDAAGLERV